MTYTPPEHIPMTHEGLHGVRSYAERYAHPKREANEWIIVLCDEIDSRGATLDAQYAWIEAVRPLVEALNTKGLTSDGFVELYVAHREVKRLVSTLEEIESAAARAGQGERSSDE